MLPDLLGGSQYTPYNSFFILNPMNFCGTLSAISFVSLCLIDLLAHSRFRLRTVAERRQRVSKCNRVVLGRTVRK